MANNYSSERLAQFDQLGYLILKTKIAPAIIQEITEEYLSIAQSSRRGGVRNIHHYSKSVQSFIGSQTIQSLLAQISPTKSMQLCRSILFDKSQSNNWFVSWHQDRTIAVASKFEAQGWWPWSVKDGINHVQPPVDVLENMITIRLHLDDASDVGGCLKVVPTSHRLGILNAQEITSVMKDAEIVNLEAESGDLVLIRPLLLHASSKVQLPVSRRVLHLEFITEGVV